MAVKYKGARGKNAINKFKGAIDVTGNIKDKIPNNIYATLANKLRGYFRRNYINKSGWSNPNFISSDYKKQKDKMLAFGTVFDIGSYGSVPVVHGSEVFGRRTDTLLNHIGSANGSKINSKFSEGQGQANLRLNMYIDTTNLGNSVVQYGFDSEGNPHKPVRRDYRRSYLHAFAERISPNNPNIFVELTRNQRKEVKEYLFNKFSVLVKRILTKQNFG